MDVRKNSEKRILEKERKSLLKQNNDQFLADLNDRINLANEVSNNILQMVSDKPLNIIYWEDETGINSFYTLFV